VGDETLLLDALDAGWSGTVSGAANLVAGWLARVVRDHAAEGRAPAEARYSILKPVLRAIRSQPQPQANKAVLHRLGRIPCPAVRLPLLEGDPAPVLQALAAIGVKEAQQNG
jgi:4-hydroxy-tetrahydrodipicolinate synthase